MYLITFLKLKEKTNWIFAHKGQLTRCRVAAVDGVACLGGPRGYVCGGRGGMSLGRLTLFLVWLMSGRGVVFVSSVCVCGGGDLDDQTLC